MSRATALKSAAIARFVACVQVRIGKTNAASPSPGRNVATGAPKMPSSAGADVPVSELATLAASGASLNRKQRRALERQSGKLSSSADGGTKPSAVRAASPPPETAMAQAPSPSCEVGTLAELKALHASGTPLNRKQRRAFARLSKDD